jgi:hypothetical protein
LESERKREFERFIKFYETVVRGMREQLEKEGALETETIYIGPFHESEWVKQ